MIDYAECHYAECHYAECHYAQYPYAECHYAKCHHAECQLFFQLAKMVRGFSISIFQFGKMGLDHPTKVLAKKFSQIMTLAKS